MEQRGVVDVHVFYTWGQAQDAVYDPGFGAVRSWDIPLLDGYRYTFVENTAKAPGSHHFKGIRNPTLPSLVFDGKPDAILVYGWSFDSHLRIIRMAKRRGIPVWFRGDSNLLDEPQGMSIRKLARRLFLRWVFSFVDRAFYVGEANRQYFKVHGLNDAQLTWAPHAIDNDRFADPTGTYEQQAQAWRKELGIDPSKPVFLFAGKFEPKKNVKALVQAFLQMPTCQLILVGNGKQEAEIRALAAHASHVFWLPFQNQSMMPVVYRLGDYFILPSVGPGETWGLAINEAMASGRAVIAGQRCGGAFDLISTDQCGRVVDGSEASIQRAVESLAVQHGQTQGHFAQQHIQSFSFEAIAQAYERAFS